MARNQSAQILHFTNIGFYMVGTPFQRLAPRAIWYRPLPAQPAIETAIVDDFPRGRA